MCVVPLTIFIVVTLYLFGGKPVSLFMRGLYKKVLIEIVGLSRDGYGLLMWRCHFVLVANKSLSTL